MDTVNFCTAERRTRDKKEIKDSSYLPLFASFVCKLLCETTEYLLQAIRGELKKESYYSKGNTY
jgi:hypothetical protein